MRIVIGYASLAAFAGTETYMVAVARQLSCLGHEVVICAGQLGAMAVVARAEGIEVTDSLDGLPAGCEAILAQDAASAFALRAHYPDSVCVYTAHSRGFALQIPPQLDGVCQAVVVLNDRVRRFVEQMAFDVPIVRLHQPVELKRFAIPGIEHQRPRQALALGNYVRGERARLLRDACRECDVELATVGLHGSSTPHPEHAIAAADIVFGTGRCVIEAMAGGRAAYVYGPSGADGWVTADDYVALEAGGFAGQGRGRGHDVASLIDDLRGWDLTMGTTNRALAYAHHSISDHVTALLALLGQLDAPSGEPLEAGQELARLVRLEWHAQGRLAAAAEHNRTLRERLEIADRERAEAEAALTAATRSLRQLQTTRRYRVITALARPLDAARRAGTRT